MIFIRDKIFSEFSEENKFESSRPITEESAIKKEDINNEKIISENEFNLPELNDFSNFYYFYFFKNKIYGINENLKLLLKKNSDKILYEYDKNDKFKTDGNFKNLKSDNNLNFDLSLNIDYNTFKKDKKEYEIKNNENIKEKKNLKTFINFIKKIKFFKKINKDYGKEIYKFVENYFNKNKTENNFLEDSLRKIKKFNYTNKNTEQKFGVKIIELDNSLDEDCDKKIKEFIAINKGESLFSLIDNINKVLKHYNLDNKEKFDFKNETNTFKRNNSFIRKEKSLTKEIFEETKKDLNNSSFQNFINNKVNLNKNNNNIILNIDEKQPIEKEFKIYSEIKDLNLEKSISIKKENYENSPRLEDSKNDEIIHKKNSIKTSLRDKKQIINIGIFTLQLATIKKNEKNLNNKENLKITVDKIDYNDLNTSYYDISIILNLICRKKKEYKIEFIIKDVSKYYKSYEKLKNISN